MGNTSSVTYKITGSKDELKDLKKRLDSVKSKPTDGLVSFIDLYEECKYDYKTDWKTGCLIDTVSLEEDVLTLKATYDWCMDDCFYKFLLKTYPNLNAMVDEFEPNYSIYQTNDKDRRFFKDKYWIKSGIKVEFEDDYIFDENWDFFENEEEVIKFVKEFSEDDRISTMEDVLNYINELDDMYEENGDCDKLLTLIEKEIIDINTLYEND